MKRKPAVRSRDREYLLNPNLVVNTMGDKVELRLPYFDIAIQAKAKIKDCLTCFNRPAKLRTVMNEILFEAELLDFLVENFVILPLDEMSFLSRGLLQSSNTPVGASLTWSNLKNLGRSGGFAIFGVPMDFSQEAPTRAHSGPQWVRENLVGLFGDWQSADKDSKFIDFELRRQIPLSKLNIYDLGDVAFEPQQDSMQDVGERIGKIVRELLRHDIRPVAIGGDHTLSFFALREILSKHKEVGVIQFDAHTDLYLPAEPTLNALNHANVFWHVRQRRELKMLFQLGVRDLFRPPNGARPIRDKRVRYCSSLELLSKTAETVFRHLPRDIPYYLSFDVDVLDPAYAPETCFPVPGGLDYYRALKLISYASSQFQIVGADFCEIGGTAASRNSAAEIVARYIAMLIFNSCPTTNLQSYVFEPRNPGH